MEICFNSFDLIISLLCIKLIDDRDYAYVVAIFSNVGINCNFVNGMNIGMNICKLTLLLCCVLACCVSAAEQKTTDSLLAQLDSVIANRGMYLEIKEKRLAELHDNLSRAASPRERFDALGALYHEYHSFNADSAYVMSLEQEALARKIGDRSLIINALFNKANIMNPVGMYHETLSIIDTISSAGLPDYLRPYFYHTKRTLYGNLASYAAFKPEKDYYEKLTDEYRDSLLLVNDSSSIFHMIIKADQLNVHDRPYEAIELLETYIRENDLSEHDMAICAWTLSESYANLNDIPNQKKYLLISAISDMKSAVREYISLRQLALLLYKEGDLDRAYRFLTIAVEDAAKCNARQRIVELNDSYPMINGIYVEMVRNQKKNLERTIIIITILSVILVCMLLYMRKQMIRIAEGRKSVEMVNLRLNELNAQLSDSNARLSDANNAISEISELKEFYIGRYMDQCVEYIEKLDSYRKTVGKMVNAGKMDDLKRYVKSGAFIDGELKIFYEQFDKTFLSLFPTFVDDFNRLLQPGEAIIPKKAGSLTPELRIFALIRLGVTDSDKIAKFLRYSLTTIYNYRTKVRNKARVDRNRIESEVAGIGRMSSNPPT